MPGLLALALMLGLSLRLHHQQHFWLNEGFTVYLERLIVGAREGEPSRHFHALLGGKALQNSVDQYGAASPLTALVPDLNGVGSLGGPGPCCGGHASTKTCLTR